MSPHTAPVTPKADNKEPLEIHAKDGFKHTLLDDDEDARSISVDMPSQRITLHGRLYQTQTLDVFFNGYAAWISSKELFPARTVHENVVASCNAQTYHICVS